MSSWRHVLLKKTDQNLVLSFLFILYFFIYLFFCFCFAKENVAIIVIINLKTAQNLCVRSEYRYFRPSFVIIKSKGTRMLWSDGLIFE